MSRILVIKLGALGDVVQALGPMAAIRAHHRAARIVLLTTKPYADFLKSCPFVDEVWIDTKPSLWNPVGLLALRQRLRQGGFARVYDLQTSDRSSWYFRLMGRPRPHWSGIAPGCSHPHANPRRDFLHTLERQAEQLAMAGIDRPVPLPDLAWVTADIARFGLPPAYALLAPGGAPHRPAKRWPADRFAALAEALRGRGIAPVLIGTQADEESLAAIRQAVPAAIDLSGKTSFADLAVLARGARLAVGNDTGPMHLAAAAGAASLVLFSNESDPSLCTPRAERVRILRRPDLADLALDEVLAEIDRLVG